VFRFDNFQKVVKSFFDLTTFKKLSNLVRCLDLTTFKKLSNLVVKSGPDAKIIPTIINNVTY